MKKLDSTEIGDLHIIRGLLKEGIMQHDIDLTLRALKKLDRFLGIVE